MTMVTDPGWVPPEDRTLLLAGLRNGAWLDSAEFPPLAWVVPQLLPEGMTLLVGGPKIGKSWLALDVALAVASGGRALGRISVGEPRPVLLLALEDGHRRLQSRARHLLFGQPIPETLHYLTKIEPNMVIPTITAWLDTLPLDARPLVILDTVGKVLPPTAPGESSYMRDYRVSGRLQALSGDRPGMALLALHHDRKAASDDFVDAVSGTHGLAGAADTILVIARRRNEPQGLLKITGRDVEEREVAVRHDQGRWELDGATLDAAAVEAETRRATANLSDRSADVLRFVQANVDGVRAKEVAEHVDGITSAKDAGTYLGRLFKRGQVTR